MQFKVALISVPLTQLKRARLAKVQIFLVSQFSTAEAVQEIACDTHASDNDCNTPSFTKQCFL